MQKSISKIEDEDVLKDISYLIGNEETLASMTRIPARVPFTDEVIEFLDAISKKLMKLKIAKIYPDVVTFGFWLRKASILQMKKVFEKQDENMYLGRGIIFHIAPSNVPVNYAYSLMAGLITGNANIVRLPSKDFPQVGIINEVIKEVLEEYKDMKPYIILARYDRNQKINDLLSRICDVRIIWGGDATIAELRRSVLTPRAEEITFADRYSLMVIASDIYLEMKNKNQIAEEFYNDTFFTDQNACTSPRIVIWMGENIPEAKKIFWETLHELVEKRYVLQPIQGINKLTSSYLATVAYEGTVIEEHKDNFIVRVRVPKITAELMDLKDNSGYFFEYDCDDLTELFDLCDDKRCQTISYIGNRKMFNTLLEKGPKGIDRIVPVGKTMDFELIWDGYNLMERLTRTIRRK